MSVRFLHGDCREVLATLPDASVHCVVTSPPYWGLREYGTATWEGGDPACEHVVGEIRTGLGMAALGEKYRGGGKKQSEPKPLYAKGECPHCGALRIDQQIGLEQSPDAYVAELVAVFREVRRVLRDDGTCWLNLGDSYNTSPPGNKPGPEGLRSSGLAGAKEGSRYLDTLSEYSKGNRARPLSKSLKPKDLMMIPARVALALQADGWYLRSDIVWAKRNCMPESVRDRPTTAHEHIFLLTKKPVYFYDAVAIEEDAVTDDMRRPYGSQGAWELDGRPVEQRHGGKLRTAGNKSHKYVAEYEASASEEHRTKAGLLKVADKPWAKRNKRSVWWMATQPFSEAHFATFPAELAETCIKAGTSERGCCSACGAPWVRQVEKESRPNWDGGDGQKHDGTHYRPNPGGGVGNDVRARAERGWLPSCSCNASVVPATVLDPFSGAGTTALVADRLGRNAIGIELNPDYVAMSKRRLERDGGLFADVAAD